jgi:hypothetical protein
MARAELSVQVSAPHTPPVQQAGRAQPLCRPRVPPPGRHHAGAFSAAIHAWHCIGGGIVYQTHSTIELLQIAVMRVQLCKPHLRNYILWVAAVAGAALLLDAAVHPAALHHLRAAAAGDGAVDHLHP